MLLLELAHVDAELAPDEERHLRHLLRDQFRLDGPGLERLLEQARHGARSAVSLHDYLNTLNSQLSPEEKRQFLAMLWQVAYADGRLDPHEEHLLRRVADLLYISHADYIRTKLEALGER